MITTITTEFQQQFKKLNTYPAILNQDITYRKNGRTIAVQKGTQILIDLDDDIALIGNEHVDVFENERTLLFS